MDELGGHVVAGVHGIDIVRAMACSIGPIANEDLFRVVSKSSIQVIQRSALDVKTYTTQFSLLDRGRGYKREASRNNGRH